ncbi:MAG: cell division protein SepF [Candidatus Nanohaloarchaea archaeon]
MALGFLNSEDSGTEQIVEDDFVELDAEMAETDEKVVIRAETLSEFEDVEAVQEHLRNNHIVWVNIKPLKGRDMPDLKRAVKRLKKTVKSIDGDMAGVDEDWIVACPGYAEIARSSDKIEE